jgi:outer membrane biogenesis lipoprotein LolB
MVKDLKLDVAGRMSSLHQEQWQVSVDRYQQYNGKTLPAKLIIKNHHLKVRLIVDQWQLTPSNS